MSLIGSNDLYAAPAGNAAGWAFCRGSDSQRNRPRPGYPPVECTTPCRSLRFGDNGHRGYASVVIQVPGQDFVRLEQVEEGHGPTL